MSFCRKIYGFDMPSESEGSFHQAKGKGVEFSKPNDKVAPDAPGFKCESLKPISSEGERGVEGKSAAGKNFVLKREAFPIKQTLSGAAVLLVESMQSENFRCRAITKHS